MENTKKKVNIKFILKIVWVVFIALFVIFLGNILVSKAKGKVPSFFGYSVLKLTTESMEPVLKPGNYILVKKVKPDEIKEQDIITFYSIDPSIYNFPNTHRVIDIDEENDKLIFTTKGDHNVIEDKYKVDDDHVIGKYICTVKILEKLSNFIAGKGMLVILILFQFACCGLVIGTILVKKNGSTDQQK